MDDVPIEAMQVHALLRSGATLPEAMKLARHSDIKMTMKYTHIGMKYQANALAALPNPCQHIVSTPGDSAGQPRSSADNERHHGGQGTESGSPCEV